MKTIKIVAASIAALTLAGCANDEYIGNGESPQQSKNTEISFRSSSKNMTRANENLESYAKNFNVWGTKIVSSSPSDVFMNYAVWNATPTESSTTDDMGWEYVGAATTAINGDEPIHNAQTIKYWDYAASEYKFWAIAPYSADYKFYAGDEEVTYTTGKDANITKVSIPGIKAHGASDVNASTSVSRLYYATPKTVAKSDFNKTVELQFNRLLSKVRVGVYETIPGYKITSIKFYKETSDNKFDIKAVSPATDPVTYVAATEDNITLYRADGKFVTNATSAEVTFTNTTGSEAASVSYTGANAAKYSMNFGEYGTYNVATVSADNTLFGIDATDAVTNNYYEVLPNEEAAPLILKCDYVLTSEDNSGETITVHGASAAIPATYTKWLANHAYTYIFKITDNSNGTTDPNKDPDGDPSKTDPEDPENPDNPTTALYPIVFDAVVTAYADEQGTITTVAMPSITTYMEGSVVANGITYKKGTPIYINVNQNGTIKDLNTNNDKVGKVALYTVAAGTTEAELVAGATKTEATGLTIGTTAKEFKGTDNVVKVSLAANQYASFTPTAAGLYAFEYLVTPAVTYKSVSCSDQSAFDSAKNAAEDNKLYKDATGAEEASWVSGTTTYYKKVTGTAAYAYKVITVVE